jgi:hypothetical protein
LLGIATNQAKQGNRTDAAATLKEAHQNAISIQFPLTKIITLTDIAVLQAELGDRGIALNTLRDATIFAMGANIVSEAQRSNMLQLIVQAQAELSDIKAATNTAAQITDESFRDSALADISMAQSGKGDIKAALETAAGIKKNAHAKSTAASGIATAQAKAGDVNGALDRIAMIDDTDTKAWALEEIAKYQVKAGDLKGALAWVNTQNLPLLKSRCLLGVADGILEGQQPAKATSDTVKQ